LHIPSNENLKNKLFFDIENILLSPIFQFDMLEKQGAQDPILYKKYAPNLKTITNENEFSKKEELEIIYHEKLLSKFIFYYLRNTSTLNEEEFVLLKEILKEFFKKWHIINTLNKKERFSSHNKYIELNTISDIKANIQEKEVYCGIIKINNLEEISTNLQQEDINVITSIISKEIKSYLDKEEKLYKVELDEYDFAIYADNKKEAEIKLNKIANTINNLVYNTYNFKTTIAAVLCNGENNKITGEKALDIAREILINSDENEKVIIK